MNASMRNTLFLTVALLSACGTQLVEFKKEEGPDPNGIRPVVISVLPLDSSTGVALNSLVSARFSKEMNAGTLNASTLSVRQGANAIDGAVTYDAGDETATFVPSGLLDTSTVYTATVSVGARDTEGLSLNSSYTWSFTTGAVAGPPAVISNTPNDGALNVAVGKKPTATFNKAMNPATINSNTFLVEQGLNQVSGVVTYDSTTNTATFTPTSPLVVGAVYTATITTGARDTGNTGLVADHVWDFTTDACGLEPIDLRSAGNFAVLGGSTVTNTGVTTSVTGDVGLSPGTSVTGFAGGQIVGDLHIDNPIAAQAQFDLTTAYNDAAGRTLCAVTVTGNLGGMVLAPGLYKSGSFLAISSGDLTLDAQGDPDAIFLFSMASSLTTTSGRRVILVNGANAANVFWQVGSDATIGSTSEFKGTIMADQAITFDTGATLDMGRALARIAAVTLDSNVIVKPAP